MFTLRCFGHQLFSKEEMELIHLSSVKVLEQMGVKIDNDELLEMLLEAKAKVDFHTKIAHIPQSLVQELITKAPSVIKLYYRDGETNIVYQGENVTYCPAGASVYIIDRLTGKRRPPVCKDNIEFIKLADALENIKVQASLLLSDVPPAIADRYRVYMMLKGSTKPILASAFTIDGVSDIKRILEVVAGSEKKLIEKPRAFLAVTPSPPLKWSKLTSQQLLDCARFRIPIYIPIMPQPGATHPATLAGSLIQGNAEFLSGLVLSQLVNAGTPVIYGPVPGLFDMRYGNIRTGAIETVMLSISLAAMGKYYGLPTFAFVGASDAKLVDFQSGFESGIGLILAALAGINCIQGPGGLDSEKTQSFEKLVIDNEICGMALRLIRNIRVDNDTLALREIEKAVNGENYLLMEHTRRWFKRERYIPSELVVRESFEQWKDGGSKGIIERAREFIEETLKKHEPEPLPKGIEKDLDRVAREIIRRYKIDSLPFGP